MLRIRLKFLNGSRVSVALVCWRGRRLSRLLISMRRTRRLANLGRMIMRLLRRLAYRIRAGLGCLLGLIARIRLIWSLR